MKLQEDLQLLKKYGRNDPTSPSAVVAQHREQSFRNFKSQLGRKVQEKEQVRVQTRFLGLRAGEQ